MRKFIVLLLALVLSCSMVYADSQDGEDPESQDTISIIENYEAKKTETLDSIETLSSSIVELQENISDVKGSTASTTYTTSDIYNLLVDNFIYPAANSNSYFALSYNCFNNINSKCNTWSSYFSNINSKINTISSNLSTVKSTLNNIDTSLGGDSAITLYSLLQDDLEILINAFGGDDPATSIWSFLSSITSNTSTLSSDNTAILNALSTVNTRLNTIISSLDSIEDFRDDYNNLTWSDPTFTYYGFTTDLTNYIDSSIGQDTDGYFVFKYTDSISNPSIYKFYLPIWSSITPFRNNYVDDIDLYFDYNNTMFHLDGNYSIEYSYSTPSLTVYFTDCAIPRNTNIYLYVDFNENCTMYIRPATYDYSLMYIDNSKLDYYYIYDMLKSKQTSSALDRLSNIYASDDIIEAKEDQQAFEDAAIEDFTGSGSAAASTSDLGDLKSVSTTIKSGLQSGGSVSNGLAPFSTSSGFWEWFTQSNSDNINSPSSGAEASRSVPDFYAQFNTRKSLNNAPDVIDFYSGNHDQLMDLFEGNER